MSIVPLSSSFRHSSGSRERRRNLVPSHQTDLLQGSPDLPCLVSFRGADLHQQHAMVLKALHSRVSDSVKPPLYRTRRPSPGWRFNRATMTVRQPRLALGCVGGAMERTTPGRPSWAACRDIPQLRLYRRSRDKANTKGVWSSVPSNRFHKAERSRPWHQRQEQHSLKTHKPAYPGSQRRTGWC